MGLFKKRKTVPEPAEPDFSALKSKLFWNLYRAGDEMLAFEDELTAREAEALRSLTAWAGTEYKKLVKAAIDKLE